MALVSLAGVAGASRAQPSPAELAFTVALDGHLAPCTAALNDLAHARRLAGITYVSPAWSSDGMRVALAAGRGITDPIWVENADGTHLHAVSRPRLATEDDSGPAWSPDGTTIAFSRYVFTGKHQDFGRAGVWTVDLRTRAEHQLSKEFGDAIAWSPDGATIAVDVGGDPEDTVVLLRPDGSVLQRFSVPGHRHFNHGVSWSPDGSQLAVGGGLIVDRNGSVVARYAPASTDEAVSTEPAWSPDGSTIAFVRFAIQVDARTSTWYSLPTDLYAAPAGGGQAVALTQTMNVSEAAPAFRPGSAAARAGTTQPCIFEGTPGRDVIRGTPKGDLVEAGAGNDLVHGGAGGDLIDGGAGNDVLYGGSGQDELRGGPGADRLHARDHTPDVINGGPNSDTAWADPKLDRVYNMEFVRR